MIHRALLLCCFLISTKVLGGWVEWPKRFTQLGQGVSKGHGLRNTCITGTLTFAGSQETSLDYSQVRSRDYLISRFGGQADAAVDLFLVGGSVSSRFLVDLSDDKSTDVIGFHFYSRGPNIVLANPRLNDAGRAAVATGNPQIIQHTCGVEAVSQLQLGAELYFNIAFKLRDWRKRTEYETKIKVKVLGFTKTKTIRHVVHDSDLIEEVSVSAWQKGGDQNGLRRALAGHDYQRCRPRDFERCQKFIEGVLAYVTSSDGFRGQMDTNYQLDQRYQDFVVASKLSSYADLGIDALAVTDVPTPSPVLLAQINDLNWQINFLKGSIANLDAQDVQTIDRWQRYDRHKERDRLLDQRTALEKKLLRLSRWYTTVFDN